MGGGGVFVWYFLGGFFEAMVFLCVFVLEFGCFVSLCPFGFGLALHVGHGLDAPLA